MDQKTRGQDAYETGNRFLERDRTARWQVRDVLSGRRKKRDEKHRQTEM
jgi:hypothetical protein